MLFSTETFIRVICFYITVTPNDNQELLFFIDINFKLAITIVTIQTNLRLSNLLFDSSIDRGKK